MRNHKELPIKTNKPKTNFKVNQQMNLTFDNLILDNTTTHEDCFVNVQTLKMP